MSEPSVRRAVQGDLPAIESLIRSEQLPSLETARFIDTFFVAESGDGIAGCCGLEVYEDAGLLRSLVVLPEYRATGLGARLTRSVIEEAKKRGVVDLYLFTLKAADFFERMGFQRCTMEDFSEGGRRSTQWQALSERPEIAKWLTPMRMRLV